MGICEIYTAQQIKFSIKDLFFKFDQIHRKLRIWSHSLKKSLIENFIFRAVLLKMVTHFVPMFLFIYSLCKIYCRILMIIDNNVYNTSRLPAEIITHFSQCLISIPLKMLENFGFLTFLRGVNKVNWTKCMNEVDIHHIEIRNCSKSIMDKWKLYFIPH